LATVRLDLVALTLEHAPALFACASDPEVSSRFAWTRHTSLADSRRFIVRTMVAYARGGHHEWGIVRRADQALIGTCGLDVFDRSGCVADVSYALARACWGRGYATEAASAVIGFGFSVLGLRAIEAQAFAENTASQQVMAKLGMCHVDTRAVGAEDGDRSVARVWRLERERWAGWRVVTIG